MESGIYEISNKANGKRYVGSAIDFDNRWRLHRKQLQRGVHHSRFLQSAWDKHGAEAFSFSKLIVCDAHNLLLYEQRCLDGLKPEYNVCSIAGPMSQFGRKRSDEARQKMAESWRARGLTLKRAAHIAALADAKRGKAGPKHSDETRAKLSAIWIGKKQSPELIEKRIAPIRGITRSQETRAKMSAGKAGKKRAPFSDEWKAKLGEATRRRHAENRAKKAAP